MIFRGSDTMCALHPIKGQAEGRQVMAVAMRYREAGLFEEGYTAFLVQGVADSDPLKWIRKEDFIPSCTE